MGGAFWDIFNFADYVFAIKRKTSLEGLKYG